MFFFQEQRVPILKAGCDHCKYVPCKTDPKSTPMYDFKLMMLPTLQPIQQSSHSCDIDGQDMSASLLRSDEQRWPSRQTWQATMGHSLGAPPMCVVAVLFKVCERNSRSLRTTTVYHAQTSKPFDLEFKGTITQKVHHLKHRQLPDHWPIGAVASPWTWISSKNLGCNHYETVEIFNSNLNRIFMTLITKQEFSQWCRIPGFVWFRAPDYFQTNLFWKYSSFFHSKHRWKSPSLRAHSLRRGKWQTVLHIYTRTRLVDDS